jgi:hypothetical protein
MAEKLTKAEKWQCNVERLERRDEARSQIIDISEKRRELAAAPEEQIRQGAYELYEPRGRLGGHGVEDWRRA